MVDRTPGPGYHLPMLPRLLLLILLRQAALAQENLQVGHLAPGMTKTQVIAALGQPSSRTPYSPHAYIVFSEQPLFAQEQSWYYESSEGPSHLLFQGDRLRMVRAQTLQWQGRSYPTEAWPSLKAEVEARSRGLTVGLNRAPVIAGYVFSNLNDREQNQRRKRFSLIADKHHFDSKGEIFQGKPGQVCQTCRQLKDKL